MTGFSIKVTKIVGKGENVGYQFLKEFSYSFFQSKTIPGFYVIKLKGF